MKYTFAIRLGMVERAVHPIYNDSVSVDYAREQGQMFYRAKFNGMLTFMKDDFDLLMEMQFDLPINLTLYKQDAYNAPIEKYLSLRFYKTDCEIDLDNGMIVVQPMVVDEYTDVLNGIENEYNLAQMAIETQSLVIDKNPMFQVYIPNADVVSCFYQGMAWEQDAVLKPTETELSKKYKFSLANILREITITGGVASGTYIGKLSANPAETKEFTGIFRNSLDAEHYIYAEQTGELIETDVETYMEWHVLVELRDLDGNALYRYATASQQYEPFGTLDYTMQGVSVTGSCNASQLSRNIYVRVLLDAEEVQGKATSVLPEDDIVADNRNYRRVVGYIGDVTFLSDRTSATPTEWGKRDDGRYFLPPTASLTYYPVARSTWVNSSFWFAFTELSDVYLLELGKKAFTLNDTYPVSGVIKAILKEIAPNVTHEATAEYSQFLYGGSDPIAHQTFRLLVTQKSNLLIGEYQDPASNVPATLKTFTDMLKTALKCYWYIENGKFKIEHIKFFENGGSYNGTPQIGVDLTSIYAKNGKPWSFAQSRYKFGKEQMPSRYEFGWMDETSEKFRGQPIDIVSRFVQGGVEQVNIPNFTSDVDFILLNPSEISKDGFALFGAIPMEGMKRPQSIEFPTYSLDVDHGVTDWVEFTEDITGKVKLTYRATADAFVQVRVRSGIDWVYPLPYYLNTDGEVHELEMMFNGNYNALQFQCASGVGNIIPYTLKVENRMSLPYVEYTQNGLPMKLQNGLLSMYFIQPNWWRYDMPAQTIKIEGVQTTAMSVQKGKKQNVVFPCESDVNPLELVRTTLGDGEIETISINLASRSGKATLQYATE